MDNGRQHDVPCFDVPLVSTKDSTEPRQSAKPRVTFSSTFTTIVTLLGSSLGSSDFWRFPFLVYRNGGGAFLIPFGLVVLTCGIPLYFMEFSVSKFSGKGAYGVWDICPMFRGTAYSIFLGFGAFSIYISVYRAWITEFMVNSFQSPLPWSHCGNPWNTNTCREHVIATPHRDVTSNSSNLTFFQNYMYTDVADNSTDFGYNGLNITGQAGGGGMSAAEEFWQFRVLELSAGLDDLGTFQWKYALYHLATRIIVVLCCYKSIKSIEKVMFLSMFGPLSIILAILVRSLTLPGALDGLRLFFQCDFNRLQDPKIWIEAAMMAFYTVGFGWGCLCMIGSHSSFHANQTRTSFGVVILDALAAIFTGMVCFSVLGNMAYTIGVPVNQIVQAGMSIGMVAYPSALAELPGPQVWSFLFFVGLLLQGLDGQIICTEISVQILENTFPPLANKRMMVLVGLGVAYTVLSLPLCTQAGGYIFLLLDWYTAVWLGPIVALIELVVVLWIYGGDRFSHDISLMTGEQLPAIIRFCLAFIDPVIVLIFLLVSMVEYAPPKYGSYLYPSWAKGLGWCLLVAVFVPTFFYIVKAAVQGKRGILKNLAHSLKPVSGWGPVEDAGLRDTYENREPTRSLGDLICFNVTGRYTEETRRRRDDDREMTALSVRENDK